jgi:hypothetical protein
MAVRLAGVLLLSSIPLSCNSDSSGPPASETPISASPAQPTLATEDVAMRVDEALLTAADFPTDWIVLPRRQGTTAPPEDNGFRQECRLFNAPAAIAVAESEFFRDPVSIEEVQSHVYVFENEEVPKESLADVRHFVDECGPRAEIAFKTTLSRLATAVPDGPAQEVTSIRYSHLSLDGGADEVVAYRVEQRLTIAGERSGILIDTVYVRAGRVVAAFSYLGPNARPPSRTAEERLIRLLADRIMAIQVRE